jgi:hypothetical protein
MKYNNNKNLFNYIIKHDYKIIKDNNNFDNIIIKYDNKEILCEYLLLFSRLDNVLIWSNENPYIDQKTNYIITIIKNNIESLYNFNYSNISDKNIIEIMNYVLKNNFQIKYNDKIINLLWILTDKVGNIIQYYIVTKLIYF